MKKNNDEHHRVCGDTADESSQIPMAAPHAPAYTSLLDREMEQLLYALSHDLRAPVRSITGFGQILLEDYAPMLDNSGKDYVQRMVAAANLLNTYIDGLLHVSRLTRGIICLEPVDISALCRDIIRELQAQQPERRVLIRVHDDILLQTDRRLVRVMLQKLIENAWKFTARSEQACIEFGMIAEKKRTVYYVRDNGAGFDMHYAHDRLFGIFQRMHTAKEFEGTGIGLATARRIINRLGGNIWARSEIGKGTWVFFEL